MYVYIVRCRDGTLYTGVAADPGARVRLHNEGKGAKYTRSRRPVKLIHIEEHGGRGRALRREAEIKRWTRDEKIALVKRAVCKRDRVKQLS